MTQIGQNVRINTCLFVFWNPSTPILILKYQYDILILKYQYWYIGILKYQEVTYPVQPVNH